MEVKGKCKFGLQLVLMYDIVLYLYKVEECGEDLLIVIIFGNDLIIILMGVMLLKYDQFEYEMVGVLCESLYFIVIVLLIGFDVFWGLEVIFEGVIEGCKCEIEGLFGEFIGYYFGGCNMMVVCIDKVFYCSKLIFELFYFGMLWIEIDYLMGLVICVLLYQQLKVEFLEVQVVNVMYIYGLLVIIFIKKCYGGFVCVVGLWVMIIFYGFGYVKMVIMVDEDVDLFNLLQVMWVFFLKVNLVGDLVQLLNMLVFEFDSGFSLVGIIDKLIIDVIILVVLDFCGYYSQLVQDLLEIKVWVEKLIVMLVNCK